MRQPTVSCTRPTKYIAGIPPKKPDIFVVDVGGMLPRGRIRAIVGMRSAVPDLFACVAHVISDRHLIAGDVAPGQQRGQLVARGIIEALIRV